MRRSIWPKAKRTELDQAPPLCKGLLVQERHWGPKKQKLPLDSSAAAGLIAAAFRTGAVSLSRAGNASGCNATLVVGNCQIVERPAKLRIVGEACNVQADAAVPRTLGPLQQPLRPTNRCINIDLERRRQLAAQGGLPIDVPEPRMMFDLIGRGQPLVQFWSQKLADECHSSLGMSNSELESSLDDESKKPLFVRISEGRPPLQHLEEEHTTRPPV
mmetsp:Transcript_63635/g.160619  ORF Transcript_63635/g.160619 Transcript_63635/m.160619 type:complete len:216 (-) Transcript_63635:1015-1662(-)